MIKIGIIGTENSHASAFTGIINQPDPQTGKREYADMQVVGVYGPDAESSREVFEIGGVDFIAERPEDFVGRVDAMMILNRKGSLHAGYAMPFIEQGLSLFIDKPIASGAEEAQRLLDAARAKEVLVCGGSSLKYSKTLPALRQQVNSLLKEKSYISAVMNYPADKNSEYDGLYFYSSHLIDMALTVFGYSVRTVKAAESQGVVTALLGYDGFSTHLVFTPGTYSTACLLFRKGAENIYQSIDTSNTYQAEVAHFASMLRSGTMLHTYDELAKPVYVIDAILKSLSSGRETAVGGLAE